MHFAERPWPARAGYSPGPGLSDRRPVREREARSPSLGVFGHCAVSAFLRMGLRGRGTSANFPARPGAGPGRRKPAPPSRRNFMPAGGGSRTAAMRFGGEGAQRHKAGRVRAAARRRRQGEAPFLWPRPRKPPPLPPMWGEGVFITGSEFPEHPTSRTFGAAPGGLLRRLGHGLHRLFGGVVEFQRHAVRVRHEHLVQAELRQRCARNNASRTGRAVRASPRGRWRGRPGWSTAPLPCRLAGSFSPR